MKLPSTIAGAALLACCLSFPALAAGARAAPKEPVWDVTLGVGAALRPTFEGSDRYTGKPLPVLAIKWRDTISFGEGGLSAYWHRGRFRIGGGLTFDPGREDHETNGVFSSGDDRLKGLGKIDTSLGLRAFAAYRLGPANVDLSATKFTGKQNDGVVADFGVSLPLPLTRKLIVTPHVRASWANDNAMRAYFGVTAAQASASIFPRFNAGAGLRDVRGGVNVMYMFNQHWFTAADTSVTRLMGDAAKSPISIADTNVTFTTMIGYRF
jgi:outer membrane protein